MLVTVPDKGFMALWLQGSILIVAVSPRCRPFRLHSRSTCGQVACAPRQA
jgi:hypothetical protein